MTCSAALQVLGTLITEWDAGRDACRQLFADEQTAKHAATQLADIALYFGFEGWLINIENDLDADVIHNVIYFLRCGLMTQCLRPLDMCSDIYNNPLDLPAC